MFECDLAHHRSVAVFYVCCTKSGVSQCTLFMVLYLSSMCRCMLHVVLWLHIDAAPPRCRISQYCRTFIPMSVSLWNNLGGPYSMLWDMRVSRAGPMFFYWPSYLLPFCLILFFLSLLSFYTLVLWGWGLQTDWVLITLSQNCTANLFLIILQLPLLHGNTSCLHLDIRIGGGWMIFYFSIVPSSFVFC